MQQSRDERSLGELFGELARETGTLVRQEVELARVEMTQKATKAGREAALVVAGGLVAYIGAIVLAFALVYILAEFMPLWLSALIVGLVIVGIGYFLVQRGLAALKRASLTPDQTIETLKEDTQWVKDQMK